MRKNQSMQEQHRSELIFVIIESQLNFVTFEHPKTSPKEYFE